MLLLAQSGAWRFGWETKSKSASKDKSHLVVFPSLEEVITRDKEQKRVVCEQDRESL